MNEKFVAIIATTLVSVGLLAACSAGGTVVTQPPPGEQTSATAAVVEIGSAETATETDATGETETTEEATQEASATAAPPAGSARFANDVLPILQAECTRCHGASRQSDDLRLDTYAALMAGSENGQVIVPGNAADSLLVQLVEAGRMPRNSAKLTDAEIQLIRDWVNGGALDD